MDKKQKTTKKKQTFNESNLSEMMAEVNNMLQKNPDMVKKVSKCVSNIFENETLMSKLVNEINGGIVTNEPEVSDSDSESDSESDSPDDSGRIRVKREKKVPPVVEEPKESEEVVQGIADVTLDNNESSVSSEAVEKESVQ